MGVIQIIHFMKHLILVLFIGSIMAIGFNSCQVDKDPEIKKQNVKRLTYYLRTNGKNVQVNYHDRENKEYQTFVSNETWHITFDFDDQSLFYFKILPSEDCYIECYIAINGKKARKIAWSKWEGLQEIIWN